MGRVTLHYAGKLGHSKVVSMRLRIALGLFSLLMAGCTDEKIVFLEPLNPTPDATSSLFGY